MDTIKPYEARDVVESTAEYLLDATFSALERYGMTEFSDLEDELSDLPIDDSRAMELTLHDQLTLLEWHAPDYDITFEDVTVENLRSLIESRSCAVIHYLATDLARERLQELQTFLESHDLLLENASLDPELASVRPDSQRFEGAYCTVYEYRGEAEEHIDLWHYVHEPLQVYVRQLLP